MTDLQAVTRDDLRDIFATALEGGINYWAEGIDVAEYPEGAEYGSDVPALGGSVVLRYDDPEQDEGTATGRFTVDAAALERGIVKAATHRGLTVRRFLDEQDADSADLVMQFAIFGDVVYG